MKNMESAIASVRAAGKVGADLGHELFLPAVRECKEGIQENKMLDDSEKNQHLTMFWVGLISAMAGEMARDLGADVAAGVTGIAANQLQCESWQSGSGGLQ